MDDRAKVGLRGPVSVCRTETTLFLQGCEGGDDACDASPNEQSHWTLTHYHPDGRIADYCHHNPDGSEWTSTYAYDLSGGLREIETRGPDGSASKTVHEYDQDGRLDRLLTIAADGTEATLETFTYNDQGKSKTRRLPEPPKPAGYVVYSVQGSDAAVSAPGATSVTTVYDSYDRPVEALFHDSQNRVLSRVTLRYDPAGRLVEETQVSGTEETLPPDFLAKLNPAQLESVRAICGIGEGNRRWQRLHRYDRQGRRVETVSHMGLGSFGAERNIMAYNQHGDLIEEKTIRDSREIAIDDQGQVVEPDEPSSPAVPGTVARFSYQYDQHTNWTEKVASSSHGPDKPFTVHSVVRRSLTYYPAV